jgi:hypothetical protein
MSPEQQAFLVLLDLAVLHGWPNGPHGPHILLHTICLEASKDPGAEQLMAAAGLEWTRETWLDKGGRRQRWVGLKKWSRERWEWQVKVIAERHRQTLQPAQLSLHFHEEGPPLTGG